MNQAVEVKSVLERLGFNFESLGGPPLITECYTEVAVSVHAGSKPPQISHGNSSWLRRYSTLSFLMNGQLFAEYHRISNMLGLPSCSHSHWLNIVGWLGDHVQRLAEWSCEQVRESVKEPGVMGDLL